MRIAMNRTIVRVSKAVSVMGVLVAVGLVSGSSSAQVVVYPPAEYVATAEPVYYEGHAAYWYGDRWYYRDAHGWQYYHGEPGYLRDWRARGPVYRRYYEHARRR
jgi:hypothetical protein